MKSRVGKYLLVLLVFYLSNCGTQSIERKSTVYIDITPVQAKQIIERNKKVLLLDVRTVQEFSEEHIEGAVNIPVNELERRLDELKRYKNFEIIVYCRSGNRSRRASEILVNHGFRYIYNLSGGIIEWKKIMGKESEENYKRHNN